jgi:hypothetical protein
MYNEAEKILLHNDCTRIIKRSSKLCIINDEMNKLFGIKDYNKTLKKNITGMKVF